MSWIRSLKSIIMLIVVALTLSPPSVLADFKIYDVAFKENKTFYMYSGAKGTIRFVDIPGDVDLVQVQIVENPRAPTAYLIGKRNKNVERSSLGSIVEFNIELIEPDPGVHPKAAVEIKVKGFRKNGEAFDVTYSFSTYIRTKDCVPKDDPVCAMTKVRCRSELNPSCIDGQEEKLITFASQCEMEKHGAQLYSYGVCEFSTPH